MSFMDTIKKIFGTGSVGSTAAEEPRDFSTDAPETLSKPAPGAGNPPIDGPGTQSAGIEESGTGSVPSEPNPPMTDDTGAGPTAAGRAGTAEMASTEGSGPEVTTDERTGEEDQ